jgi:hypothetical protein
VLPAPREVVNLINGNALVGVGTIAEIKAKFEAAGTSMFPVDADNLLGQAERPLKRLANLSDATLADVAQARDAMEEARIAVGDTKALCDIITAQGLDPEIKYQFENWKSARTSIQKHPSRHRALKTLEGLKVFHFPIAFPEVFLRRRAGFDVLLGNPPWDKLHKRSTLSGRDISPDYAACQHVNRMQSSIVFGVRAQIWSTPGFTHVRLWVLRTSPPLLKAGSVIRAAMAVLVALKAKVDPTAAVIQLAPSSA